MGALCRYIRLLGRARGSVLTVRAPLRHHKFDAEDVLAEGDVTVVAAEIVGGEGEHLGKVA